MKQYLLRIGVVAIFAMAVLPVHAEQAAESMTPEKCKAMGITVKIDHKAGARFHSITVKIDKALERFQKDFVPVVKAIDSQKGIGFSVPVAVTKDDQGHQSITFSMSRETLAESRLWLDGKGFIELKAFL